MIAVSSSIEPCNVVIKNILIRGTLHLNKGDFLRSDVFNLHVDPFSCTS